MNNTEKSIVNRLYVKYLEDLTTTFASGNHEDIVKASAKLVTLQEIMKELKIKDFGAPKEFSGESILKDVVDGHQPTVVPTELKAPTAPPAYRPKTIQGDIDFSKLSGMNPQDIFKMLENGGTSNPEASKKVDNIHYGGPRSLVSNLPFDDTFGAPPASSGERRSISDVMSDDLLNNLSHVK